jgi:transcriptional regulator with XRE-family HTH domain
MAKEWVAGELIRSARRRAGLSQAALAAASGIVQPLISRYESGQVQPTLPTLERLISAAGGRLRIAVDATPPTGQGGAPRPVATHRGPTDEESRGMDAAFVRLLENQPPAVRAKHDKARHQWVRKLRGTVVSDEPAFAGKRDS